MRGVQASRTLSRLGITVAVVALGATACLGGGASPRPAAADRGVSTVSPAPPRVVSLRVVSPADKATKVLTSSAITFATNTPITTVRLVGPKGAVVPGAFASDGVTWIPGRQLEYGSAYTVTATATAGGRTGSVTSTFRTMGRPGSITGADLYVHDGETVGVGMPVVVEFTKKIPESQRAAVEKRLFVTSTPAVEGAWHWFSSSEVHYRPRDYWKPGTKVSVRLAIGGMPMGNGNYGKRDRFARFTIGRAITSRVVNAEKTMYVYRDGVLLRKMPVSLGKPSTPTSSGVMVAMEKAYEKTFDSGTFGVPADSADGYRQKVYYDVRFTWGGEFTHAAPWSVYAQGSRNVSHGCVNLSTENARWFYELTQRGDVIEVVGTERKVKPGDGWTDWTMSWDEYVKGSALR